MNKVTAEISHEEILHAWAPIADVSTMLDKIKAAGVDDEIIVSWTIRLSGHWSSSKSACIESKRKTPSSLVDGFTQGQGWPSFY